MKLEELVQKLENANPWTVEAVEKILGTKLSVTYSSKHILSYESGQLDYDEGLLLVKTELRLNKGTNEMTRLIVNLSDDASCFMLDRIKRAYPDIQLDPYGPPRGKSLDEETGFWAKRPWGHISFGFKERRPNCLSSIIFIPKGKE